MAYKQIDQYPEPLIGLQHVIEFWSGNKSVFWCDLCEVSCSNAQGVIAHAVGRQHRTNYMRSQYSAYLKVIESSESELELLLEYSRIIEGAEGRQSIKRRNDENMSAFVEYTGQRDSYTGSPDPASPPPAKSSDLEMDQSESGRTKSAVIVEPFQEASVAAILHKLATRSGLKNVSELFKHLTDSFVTNEEEATKALEAANFLTKAVLNYRLSSSPK